MYSYYIKSTSTQLNHPNLMNKLISTFENMYRAQVQPDIDDADDADDREDSMVDWTSPTGKRRPHIESITFSVLRQKFLDKQIDANPWWQRRKVWTTEMKKDLLLSIHQQDYIPPIVINQRNDGIWELIDGKQRFTTIMEFYDNAISTFDKIHYSRDKCLSETGKRLFDNCTVIVARYEGLTEEETLVIFANLQKGIRLSPGEKLNARNEAIIVFLKNLLQNYTIFHGKPNGHDEHLTNALKLASGLLDQGDFKISSNSIPLYVEKEPPENYRKILTDAFQRLHRICHSNIDVYQSLSSLTILAIGYMISYEEVNCRSDQDILALAQNIEEELTKHKSRDCFIMNSSNLKNMINLWKLAFNIPLPIPKQRKILRKKISSK